MPPKIKCISEKLSSKIKIKLSRGEIYVQILYPPTNKASQGNYFLPKSHKLAGFVEKEGLQKQLWQPNRQTNYLTPYTGVC